MNKFETLIMMSLRGSLYLPYTLLDTANDSMDISKLVEMLSSYGYVLDDESLERIKRISKRDFDFFYDDVKGFLSHAYKNTNVQNSNVFYQNFPLDVYNKSYFELYIYAMFHYISDGALYPSESVDVRDKLKPSPKSKLKKITLSSESDLFEVYANLLRSSDSLKPEHMIFVLFLSDKYSIPDDVEIRYNEIAISIAGKLFSSGKYDQCRSLVKTTRDVLRLANLLSGGDVALIDKVSRFENFSRKERRFLADLINEKAVIEDVAMDRNLWKKLFHIIHIGEYKSLKNANNIAAMVRSKKPLRSINGQIDILLDRGELNEALELYKIKPGEFARNLDFLLRKFPKQSTQILNEFQSVSNLVSSRVLLQVLGHFYNRDRELRGILSKSEGNSIFILDGHEDDISSNVCIRVIDIVNRALGDIFSKYDHLGKVWIDPKLKGYRIPSQQRSASTGNMMRLARGSRVNIGSSNTIRMFLHWIGIDIDLSAVMFDENFNRIDHCSYENIRCGEYAVHSGDIVHAPAPKGASEYIDVRKDLALSKGVRYVLMTSIVFNGVFFSEHEECFVGFMERDGFTNSGEIFEPSTVKHSINLNSDSKMTNICVFDLVTNEVIWVDVSYMKKSSCMNVNNQADSISKILECVLMNTSTISCYDLFKLHAEHRGEVVKNKSDADFTFGLNGCNIAPDQFDIIQSDYI